MRNRLEYATMRVHRLRSKLRVLRGMSATGNFKGRTVQQQINSTKYSLNRWLREFPELEMKEVT